eukprot:1493247-Pyramimonas_sp.AAC.1
MGNATWARCSVVLSQMGIIGWKKDSVDRACTASRRCCAWCVEEGLHAKVSRPLPRAPARTECQQIVFTAAAGSNPCLYCCK